MSKNGKLEAPWQGGAEGFATEDPNGKAIAKQPLREGTLSSFINENKPLERNDNSAEASTVNEREAEALREAIPADVINRVLDKRTKKVPESGSVQPLKGVVIPPKSKRAIVRGDVLLHKKSGKRVTVVKPEVGVNKQGVIMHRVMTRGMVGKFDVPENVLEELP